MQDPSVFAAIRRAVFQSAQWRLLTKSATDVYIAMAMYAERGVGQMYRTQYDLALDTGYTVRAIEKAVKLLRKSGFVVVVRLGCRGQATVYELLIIPNGISANNGVEHPEFFQK